MQITLSGGNFGGEIVGFIYALIDNIAVFYGMA